MSEITSEILFRVDWQRRAAVARWLVLGGYALLLLTIAAATLLWPGQGRAPSALIWLLLSVPLLVVLPGIWRGGVNAHAWLSFIATLYFAAAVTDLPLAANVETPPLRVLDLLELAASVDVFVAAMLYVRWRSRALRAAASRGDE